jgi:hypothetical protein
MLRQLGVQEAAAGVAAASAAEQHAAQPIVRRPPARPRERRPPPPLVHLPVRASKRQRGERPLTQEEVVAAAAEELGAGALPDNPHASEQDLGALRWLNSRGPCACPAGNMHAFLLTLPLAMDASLPALPRSFPSALRNAEHGALLHPEQYFELIGQDVSGAVRSGAQQSAARRCVQEAVPVAVGWQRPKCDFMLQQRHACPSSSFLAVCYPLCTQTAASLAG